jgi:hypothetical protein
VESFVQARHRDEHKRKVTRAKSLIQNDWSVREEVRLQASRRNVKNDQVQDDRYAAIEKENVRLLLRMQEIGRHAEQRRDLGGAGASKAAAQIALGLPSDALVPKQAPKRSMPRCSSLPAVGCGSNGNGRMKELRRIDEDNRKLLKRLNGARPTVNNKNMEDEHRAQQRVMRMRQERGPKVPQSRVPLPFSAPPAPPLDPETERLQNLHADLLRRVEELDMADRSEEVPPLATPLSSRSQASAAGDRDTEDAFAEDDDAVLNRLVEVATERREYIGGQMPEHSRALVEKLMEEHEEKLNEFRVDSPVEEVVEDDKDAVAKMLAAADALDAQEFDPFTRPAADFLSYENVVQRSRATLEASGY